MEHDCSLTDNILQIFTSKKISRGIFQEDKVKEIIKNSIEKGCGIPLVGFWGLGEKTTITEYDKKCIGFLNSFIDRVKKINNKGVNMTIILADNHGENNGYENITYLKEMENVFQNERWKTIWLSHLWKKWDINNKIMLISEEQWSKILIAPKLEEMAKRNSLKDPMDSAKHYYQIRTAEKHLIPMEFPNTLWWSYSSSEFQDILPEMPGIFLWAGKSGQSTCPWFRE